METQNKTEKRAVLGKVLIGIAVMILIVAGAWNFNSMFSSIPKTLSSLSVSAVTLFRSFIPGDQPADKVATSTPQMIGPNENDTPEESDTPSENTPEITENLSIGQSNQIEQTNEQTESEQPEMENSRSGLTAGSETTHLYPMGERGSVNAPAKPDLAAHIIEIGVINKITNEFTATTSLRHSDRIAVKFEVKNQGGIETGQWFFNAVLPTYPMHIFTSEIQQSLAPGEKIEYTLGFDSVAPGEDDKFTVNADPANLISELDEENNIATIPIQAN